MLPGTSTGPVASETVSESGTAKSQANKLLNQAGSPELAKQAIDAATRDRASGPGRPDDKFAKQWGFASYLSLIESSTPMESGDGRHWWLTSIGTSSWIVWNDTDYLATQYDSKNAAQRHAASAGLNGA